MRWWMLTWTWPPTPQPTSNTELSTLLGDLAA